MLLTLLVLTLCGLLFGEARLLSDVKKRRHRRYRRKAAKVYRLMNDGKMTDGARLNYLRKINPYVFEELVVMAFGKKGYSTRKGDGYSGDGGLDGEVYKDGKCFLLQCKRYSNYISPEHVAAFIKVCEERKRSGFFVHTGKTGKKARITSYSSPYVTFISGQRLLSLIDQNNEMI